MNFEWQRQERFNLPNIHPNHENDECFENHILLYIYSCRKLQGKSHILIFEKEFKKQCIFPNDIDITKEIHIIYDDVLKVNLLIPIWVVRS